MKNNFYAKRGRGTKGEDISRVKTSNHAEERRQKMVGSFLGRGVTEGDLTRESGR